MAKQNVREIASPSFFHKLYGIRKPKTTYYGRDWLDYALMILLSAVVVRFSYRHSHIMSIVGFVLCGFVLITFIIRHGIELRVPVILKRPQEVLYLFIYKLQNLRPAYFIALGALLLENIAISATPNLPHHVEMMRRVAFGLFYIHFILITVYRTAILFGHLKRRELVREVLMQTPWKRVIREKTNITLEIVHAYCTGVLTHLLLLAPWYLVITYSRFSIVFLPISCLVSVMIQVRWLKVFNEWLYRDHWLGHNSECEFIFLHGSHHDAIPSGLIAVAENGFLEGFLRFTLGSPLAFYNPVVSSLIFTREIRKDINLHQYIPGLFPRIPRVVMEVFQHARHHYGELEPYGLAIKTDQPDKQTNYESLFSDFPDKLRNSGRLDEELTGFKWDNASHRRILDLWDKYQK
jgi:hypothetical protein